MNKNILSFLTAVLVVATISSNAAAKNFRGIMKEEIGPVFKVLFVDVVKNGQITANTTAASVALVEAFLKVQETIPSYHNDASKSDGMREATPDDKREFKMMNAEMLAHAQNLAAFIAKNDVASAKAELGRMNQLRESAHDAFKGQ